MSNTNYERAAALLAADYYKLRAALSRQYGSDDEAIFLDGVKRYTQLAEMFKTERVRQ